MQQIDAQASSCATGGDGMTCGSAPPSGAGESLYRSVERQFKASAATAAKRGRRSKHAAKAPVYACEQDYAAEFERWRADTIDCATPSLDNNTPANRARIQPRPLVLPSPPPAVASDSAPGPTSVRWLSPSARLYAFSDLPGFYILRGALDANAQAWWSWRCLQHYSRAEHTNLTNLAQLAQQQQQQQQQQAGKEDAAVAHAAAAEVASSATGPSGSVQLPSSSTCPSAVSTNDAWARYCSTGDTSQQHKLRWSSLGYHYDWSQRCYTPDARSSFPEELASLSGELATAAGFAALQAEAAIVNFYPHTACMGAHVDDAELTKLQPIVSVSLGCTAVFMLGGASKSSRPTAVYLRAGDVAVMGGESRVCFHGVPRILDGSFGTTHFQPYRYGAVAEAATEAVEGEHKHAEALVASAAHPTAPSPSPSPSPSSEGEEQGHEKRQKHEDGCRSVVPEYKTDPSLAVPLLAQNRAALQRPREWSAEGYYAQLRFQPLPQSDDATCASTASSAGATDPTAPAVVPFFPAGLPYPTRAELLHTFRYLRHSRLNINVRQVEDEHFTYRQGLTSHKCRNMPLDVQLRMQQQQQQQQQTSTNVSVSSASV